MKRCISGIICATLVLVLLGSLAATIRADDDDGRKHQRRRERRHGDDNHNGRENLKPVVNPTYADQCGACHFAYQPELLPAGSWQKILDGSDDHFGESVDLEADAMVEIADYLASNAADSSPSELARKIMRCLAGQTPMRITDVPCFRREHHEISPRVINRKSVGSLSNCIACHRTAEKGIYDDDEVSIPK